MILKVIFRWRITLHLSFSAKFQGDMWSKISVFFFNSESGGFTLLGVLLEAAVIVAFERLFVSGNSC